MMTYHFLQNFTWFVVSTLASLYVFLLFVQGAGSMLLSLGSDERQRTIIFNAVDIKWRFTLSGFIIYAVLAITAFPGFQANGFELHVWEFFLTAVMLHAASCELLRRFHSIQWLKCLCRWIIVVCGFAIPFMVGFNGSDFITGASYKGLLNISFGFLYVTAAQTSALLYLYCIIDDYELSQRIIRSLVISASVFVMILLASIYLLFTHDGIEYDANGVFHIVPLKYVSNITQMPHALCLFFGGFSFTIIGIVNAIVHSIQRSFWYFAVGIISIVLSLFFICGFNNTAVFPDYSDPQRSLSLANSSASYATLLVIDITSLLVLPAFCILLYRIWSRIDKKQR